MNTLSRRQFVRTAALAAGAAAFGSAALRAAGTEKRRKLFTAMGIAAPLTRADEMKAAGADYLVPAVADVLMPEQPDSEFERQIELLAHASLPVFGCNSFLRDPRLRCTGPDADHAAVLAFAGIVFRRLARIGGKVVVFGSGGARRIPEDWPKARADEQFVALLRAMGPLAAQDGVTVCVEQLRAAECNYLNHVGEVRAVVAAADHPHVRLLADLYHMAVMGDTPADLAAAMPWLGLVEIAEKENRTVPGVAGDDFRPYFAALARGGYSGRITIEGKGTPAQLKPAFATIVQQAADVA